MTTKVLIVDDHDLFRAGIRLLLESMGSFEVAAAATAPDALEMLKDFDADCVLLDIVMPDEDGIWALQRMSSAHPNLPVIVVSSTVEDVYITDALDAGARAFLTKSATADQLSDAIKTVLADGGVYLHPSVAQRLVTRQRSGPAASGLTEREVDVLAMLVEGDTNTEIAEKLGLSQKRVKSILTVVFRKLGVTNRTQAASKALQDKIVTPKTGASGSA